MLGKALHQKKEIALYALILMIVMSAVFLSVTLFIKANNNQLQMIEIETSEKNLLALKKSMIANRISTLAKDTLFIADSLAWAQSRQTPLQDIQRLWIAFSDRMLVYHQIRYLDMEGNERIRINHEPAMSYAVQESQLQNKANRYYFQNTLPLPESAIYISLMDLNMENGVIEQPIRPMLRLGTPFYDTDGEQQGIIVLNYLAEDLLNRFENGASASAGETYLLNADGYWLSNVANRDAEWAFMYDDRMDLSFANAYPQEWETIKQNDSGNLLTDHGMFYYTSLIPSEEISSGEKTDIVCDSDALYLVSFIASASAAGALFSANTLDLVPGLLSDFAVMYVLMALLSAALALVFVVNRLQRAEIKYYSEYDALTGLYNRRAGYDKLQTLKTDTMKRACEITIFYIDINGLKEVNDILGHDAGDELIKTVASVLQSSIRSMDFVSRLGGDEFLIVLDSLNQESAENVWKRVSERFDKINAEENRPYLVSVSHGTGTFHCSAKMSVDQAIQIADEKMYQEKRLIKQDLNVIRENAKSAP